MFHKPLFCIFFFDPTESVKCAGSVRISKQKVLEGPGMTRDTPEDTHVLQPVCQVPSTNQNAWITFTFLLFGTKNRFCFYSSDVLLIQRLVLLTQVLVLLTQYPWRMDRIVSSQPQALGLSGGLDWASGICDCWEDKKQCKVLFWLLSVSLAVQVSKCSAVPGDHCCHFIYLGVKIFNLNF